MSGVRSVRIIRGDKKYKSRNTHTTIGTGGCPTITLGDFLNNINTIPISGGTILSLITGGTAPYTVGTVTGDTTHLAFGILQDGVDYYLMISGDGLVNGDFGIKNINATVIDANLCESTAKDFTIEIVGSFAKSSIIPFLSSTFSEVLFENVAGMPTILGVGCELRAVLISGQVVTGTLDNTDCYIAELQFDSKSTTFWVQGDGLSGTDFSDTNFTTQSAALIAAGTPPYSGNYSDNQGYQPFADMFGCDPNYGFYGYLAASSPQVNKGFDAGNLTIAPLPTFSTTGSIVNGFNFFTISVSGLSTPYSNSQLKSLLLDITCSDMSNITDIALIGPSPGFGYLQIVVGGVDFLAGADFDNTVFFNQTLASRPEIQGYVAPYDVAQTFGFRDASSGTPTTGFDATFNNQSTNGDWILYIYNAGGTCSLNNCELTFGL